MFSLNDFKVECERTLKPYQFLTCTSKCVLNSMGMIYLHVFLGVQAMVCAIAEVESSRLPLAYRFEPKLGEASTGLMQTLQSTAEWLAT